MILGSALFNFTPLYNDYQLGAFSYPRPRNQTLDFGVFFSLPGYVQDDHFYITAAYCTYASFYCAIIMCIIDLLLCLMAFQIIGHIKVLMLDFETMERLRQIVTDQFIVSSGPKLITVEMFNADENDAIHIKLSEMIKHHKLIVR